MRPQRRALSPNLDRLDERCLLSGLTPAQVSHAYGLDAITFQTSAGTLVKGDGSGATIALIEAFHAPNLASDLRTFDRAFGLPDPVLTVVNKAGNRSDSGWTVEEAMDVEWAHAIAPGANLLVVEARSDGLEDLLSAVKVARGTPGVVAISMSWGMSEVSWQRSYDQVFTTPAGHPGITFLAASGDNGSAGGPEWPSSSPNVVSVGGTTLRVQSAGNYISETAWTYSGGGYSRYEPEPAFQTSVQRTGTRSTPDVAFIGDPDTGVQVYSTEPGATRGSWQVVAGTSLGTPAWAGIIAIADQGRALQGKASLDGPTQTLPALYASPSSNYHAVAAASSSPNWLGSWTLNGLSAFARKGSKARSQKPVRSAPNGGGTLANTVTGLGSPRGQSVVTSLLDYSPVNSTPLTRQAKPARVSAHARAAILERVAIGPRFRVVVQS